VSCLWVWLALSGHAPSLTSSLDLAEVEALPSRRVLLSRRSPVLWPPPTSHPTSHGTSHSGLSPQLRRMWPADRMRPPLFHRRLSQHPAPPTPEGSSALLSRLSAPSMAFALHERLGSPWVPVGLTSRRCRIRVMLRAAVLHPFLRGIRRFSTSSHPEALGACYVASWQLPRPDLHRSADDDFSGHTRPWIRCARSCARGRRDWDISRCREPSAPPTPGPGH
jgi:hypothetical protein